MGNKKITMQKLRQVLRFYSQGKGTKTISSIVGISRNTVKKYLQIFHTLHMDFEDVVGLEDSRLGELFSLTPKPALPTIFAEKMWLCPIDHTELKHNVNLVQNPGWTNPE